MKKVIIGLSAVLISAFVIILAVNAQDKTQETKKACTETAKDGSKCPAASSSCCKMKYGSTAEAKACDKEKAGCEGKCKEGKCDHEGCKSACTNASEETKKCDQAKKAGTIN
jgi:NH3-dependent NAD+ synthetase